MKGVSLRKIPAFAVAACALVAIWGCDGQNNTVTFLDLVNTALLGVTAAGSIFLIRNT